MTVQPRGEEGRDLLVTLAIHVEATKRGISSRRLKAFTNRVDRSRVTIDPDGVPWGVEQAVTDALESRDDG